MTYRSAIAALIVFVINLPVAFLLLALNQTILAIMVVTAGTMIIWAIAFGIIEL